MEGLLNHIGQYVAYGVIAILAFWNIFKTLYPKIKAFLTKTPISTNTTNVNITTKESESLPKEIQDNYKYFLYFLLEQNKILKALGEVKSDVLKDQMEYYTKHVKNIRMYATDIMIQILESAGMDDTKFGTYFSNFENFMEVCEGRCESIFRQMCKDNHFSDKTTQEFKELTIRNYTIIEGTIRDLLRRRYPQKNYVKNFSSQFDNFCERIKDAIFDSFDHAKNVAVEKHEKVLSAKECFEKQVSQTTGMTYSLDI